MTSSGIRKKRALGRKKLQQRPSLKGKTAVTSTSIKQKTQPSPVLQSLVENVFHNAPPLQDCLIHIRIDANLFETISNAVRSAITASDFRYNSTSDFIREALNDYRKGNLRLTAQDQSGPRKSISLRVSQKTKSF